MATPDSPEAGQDSAAFGPALPGHTVDELRSQGKAAEARVEFERLIQEGVESGIDPRAPAAIFDSIRGEIGNRATASSGSNGAGA